MANGDKAMAMFTKIAASLIVAATIGVWAFVVGLSRSDTAQGEAIRAAESLLARIKTEGTDLCQKNSVTNIQVAGDMRHIQSDMAEVKADVKAMHEQLIQGQLLQREILTKLDGIQ